MSRFIGLHNFFFLCFSTSIHPNPTYALNRLQYKNEEAEKKIYKMNGKINKNQSKRNENQGKNRFGEA